MLFHVSHDMLNPGPHTVEDASSQFMTLNPTAFSGVRDSPNKYLVHYILPPVVYPCCPAAMKLAEVVKRFKVSSPSSNFMTITVNVIEKSEIA